jgi:hypothetical protein
VKNSRAPISTDTSCKTRMAASPRPKLFETDWTVMVDDVVVMLLP